MRLASTLPRYLLAGAANTALSYLLYLGLLQMTSYRLAYVTSFIAGIALSYLLLRFAVFRSPGRRHSVAMVIAGHLAQLALGITVVEIWISILKGPEALAALVAVAVCTPLMFIAHRWIFARADFAEEGVDAI